MKKICTENQYDLYFDEKDGYSIIDRENNISYSLLEGKSLTGAVTSDIIFIRNTSIKIITNPTAIITFFTLSCITYPLKI